MTMPASITRNKTILFDLDGTLLEVRERFFLAFNRTLAAFGHPAPLWEPFLDEFRKDTLTRYFPEDGESGKRFLWTLLMNFNQAGNEIPVQGIPGVQAALHTLQRRGYRMSVVTGRRAQPESIKKELQGIGFLEYFDHIFSQVDGYATKGTDAMELLSKKAIIPLAADRMGVPVDSCILVGDWTGDIQSAREAGVGFIVAVLSGGLEQAVLDNEGPHLILPSVADLPDHLP